MRYDVFCRCVLGAWLGGWGLAVIAWGGEPSGQPVMPATPEPTAVQEGAGQQSQPSTAPGALPKSEPTPASQESPLQKESPPQEVQKPTVAESPPAVQPAPQPLGVLPAPETKVLMKRSREAEAAILKVLGEKSEADFLETPLRDIIDYWKARHKISIELDHRELERATVGGEMPVTVHVKDCSFRAVLERVLKPLGLAWTIQHEALWITTPEEVETILTTRVYRVDDLVPVSERKANSVNEMEFQDRTPLGKFANMITKTVRGQSWEDAGGPGTMEALELQGKAILVVTQSWPVHLEIAQLLEELRETLQGQPSEPKAAPASESPKMESAAPKTATSPPTPAASASSLPKDTAKVPGFEASTATSERDRKVEVAILKALGESSKADFSDTPLSQVIEFWSNAHKIPIVLDRQKLDVVGVGADTPITLKAEHGSFRSLLERVLELFDLTWTIRHEVLLITTPEEAENHLTVRVYPVEDWFAPARNESSLDRVEELIDLITLNIRPDTWDSAGGVGSINSIRLRDKAILVVTHTWPVHLEIAQLLEDLREAAQAEAPTEKSSTGPRAQEKLLQPRSSLPEANAPQGQSPPPQPRVIFPPPDKALPTPESKESEN